MQLNLVFILTLCALSIQLNAQTFNYTPTSITVEEVIPTDYEVVGHSFLSNISSEEINIQWTKTIIEMPDGWEATLCDKKICHFPTVNTANYALAVGDSSIMDVHVYPNGIPGCAIIEIEAVNIDNPNESITATYYFDNCSVSTQEQNAHLARLYPNPSTGLFSLDAPELDIAQIALFNTQGQHLAVFDAQQQNYDISNLAKGAYLLRLLDKDGIQLATKWLHKL